MVSSVSQVLPEMPTSYSSSSLDAAFTDEENLPLMDVILDEEISQRSSSSKVKRDRKTVVAIVCFLFLLVLGILTRPNSPLADTEAMIQLFSVDRRETGRNVNSKELIYLDRHTFDCGYNPIQHFRMNNDNGNVWYEYYCLKVTEEGIPQSGKTITLDNGFNEDHNLIYFDRQHAWCWEGYYMTKLWGRNDGGNFGYQYECRQYDVKYSKCSDYYTGYNEATDKSIIYLDRHNVECPSDSA